MTSADEVLQFWLDELEPKDWYSGGEALDTRIKDRFEGVWERTMEGAHSLWLCFPSSTLAYLLVTDQFSRNMFRGEGKAFASDKIALAAAKAAIHKGWDLKIDEPARQFFYMPLMHSENLNDQNRSVRLFHTRMDSDMNMIHARAHREIIRRYGRFPYRNEALGRRWTAPEREFMEFGGYATVLKELQDSDAKG